MHESPNDYFHTKVIIKLRLLFTFQDQQILKKQQGEEKKIMNGMLPSLSYQTIG